MILDTNCELRKGNLERNSVDLARRLGPVAIQVGTPSLQTRLEPGRVPGDAEATERGIEYLHADDSREDGTKDDSAAALSILADAGGEARLMSV